MVSGLSSKRRPWLLTLHLYGGLITCWYLLIYGITSLAFNHPWLLPEREGIAGHWERALEVREIEDDLQLAEAIRDELGLMGWPLPWAMGRDGEGNLRFEMARPGKKYEIQVVRGAGVVRVEERRTGLRSVLGFLHGSTERVPNAPVTAGWGIYTEITSWFVLFAVGSGVWLWVRRAKDHRAGLTVLAVSVLSSLAMMAYLYWKG